MTKIAKSKVKRLAAYDRLIEELKYSISSLVDITSRIAEQWRKDGLSREVIFKFILKQLRDRLKACLISPVPN